MQNGRNGPAAIPQGEAAAGKEKRGLECPKCGCKHLPVVYTRATILSRVMRRRECRNCGRRITTYERSGG